MTDETQEHSVRSPSSSHRWLRCLGSINAERGLPDRVGIEAAEGTLFHEHAELALRLGIDPEYFKQGLYQTVSGHNVAFNQEMVDAMKPGLAFLFDLLSRGEDYILFVEQKVRIEPWTLEPNGFGTSDVCIVFPKLRLVIVFDWKYGKIAVSPVENDQLSLYGLGCWESIAGEIFGWDPTDVKVELIIWQPRVPGGGGKWDTTMEELLKKGEWIKQQAAGTYDPDAPRTPGTKQCMYCKAAGRCKELALYNLEQYSMRFDDIDDSLDYGIEPVEPDFSEWTPERRAFVLLHEKTFKRWIEKLKAAAMEDYARGLPTPYQKVVQGDQGRRFYKKQSLERVKYVLREELGDKGFEVKPLTPAKAQTALGLRRYKELLAEHVDRPPGKYMLVPETDGRPAIKDFGTRFEEALAEIEAEEEETGAEE